MITEAANGAPVAGALVILTDEQGIEATATVSSAAGAFLLRAPSAGVWRVEIQRIGYATERSEPLRLAAGEGHRLEMALRETAVALPEIRVETEGRRCSLRPREGEEAFRLWNEARKALRVSEWTGRRNVFVVQVTERAVTPWGTTVGTYAVTRNLTSGRSPFQQASVDELLEGGFVRDTVDGRLAAYGPDAELLLSDAFLDTHCFRAVRGHDDRVGLEFEPVETGSRVDIHGTLWLDAATSELRRIDFGYTGLRDRDDLGSGPPASGAVNFERLDDGRWIVRSWWIRLPAASGRYGSRDYKIYAERAGEVIDVRKWTPSAARPVPSVRDLFTPGDTAPADSAAG